MNFKQEDIELVYKLEQYDYAKTMNGVVPLDEQSEFKRIKNRLKDLSDSFKNKYDKDAGLFESDRATGNPISFHGNMRRVWSGIFKGADNKQYSAQISFVINTKLQCLDVGFYFGSASSFNVSKSKRAEWEMQLKTLGQVLYEKLSNDFELRKVYDSLFNFGFKAEIKGQRVTSKEWLENLSIDPTHSSIVINLKPDSNGIIEYSNIGLYVSMVLPLISVLPVRTYKRQQKTTKLNYLTPEQRAKQAERRALIGLAGENYIMEIEDMKLSELFGDNFESYPKHQSIISDSFHYDILSKDENGEDIYIEVKTTTHLKSEQGSKIFYISTEEMNFYNRNKKKFKLYRVYDVDGTPSYEILNLDLLETITNSYRVKIP